jgi:hypothetical protein
MFDDILQMVKDHMGSNPAVASAIPSEQADAIHTEIANHLANGIQNSSNAQAAAGGILSEIENSLRSGSLASSAITGGLVSSLASKFGLPPAITGAIAASVPGLLQRYLNQNAASSSSTGS